MRKPIARADTTITAASAAHSPHQGQRSNMPAPGTPADRLGMTVWGDLAPRSKDDMIGVCPEVTRHRFVHDSGRFWNRGSGRLFFADLQLLIAQPLCL
ncbi:hypothetical protein GCM10022293_57150 [Azospirillum formosense]